jgi:hypothetical protein
MLKIPELEAQNNTSSNAKNKLPTTKNPQELTFNIHYNKF